jgi:hypothetical protein
MSSKDEIYSKTEVTDLVPKEGFVNFLNTRLGVSKEVAIKIFPDLAKILAGGTEAIEKAHNSAVSANSDSQTAAMEHEKLVANVIAEQLRLKNLSPEERRGLISLLEDSAIRASEKDTENKDFLLKMAQIVKTGVVATAVLAIVVVGSTAAVKGKLK